MAKLTKADLIGVWLLDEFIVHRESGERFVWPGRQSGTLIYTDDGYVSVAQNRDPLPNPSEADRRRVSNFYTATYELDLANDRVWHTALQSSVPSVVGARMERQVQWLPDGRLQLSGQGLQERVTLVWRRAR